jgi:hypothetical protein
MNCGSTSIVPIPSYVNIVLAPSCTHRVRQRPTNRKIDDRITAMRAMHNRNIVLSDALNTVSPV